MGSSTDERERIIAAAQDFVTMFSARLCASLKQNPDDRCTMGRSLAALCQEHMRRLSVVLPTTQGERINAQLELIESIVEACFASIRVNPTQRPKPERIKPHGNTD